MTAIPTLSSKDRKVAEYIRDRRSFKTYGAFSARKVDGLTVWDSGQLRGADLDQFRSDCLNILFVVYSYSTPIAWYSEPDGMGKWHRVSQKFSNTTSKHQGKLYLIED